MAVKWKCEMLSESLWAQVKIPEVATVCDAIWGRATTDEQSNGDDTVCRSDTDSFGFLGHLGSRFLYY